MTPRREGGELAAAPPPPSTPSPPSLSLLEPPPPREIERDTPERERTLSHTLTKRKRTQKMKFLNCFGETFSSLCEAFGRLYESAWLRFDPQMGTTNNAALIGMQDTLQGAVYMAQFCKVRKRNFKLISALCFPQ